MQYKSSIAVYIYWNLYQKTCGVTIYYNIIFKPLFEYKKTCDIKDGSLIPFLMHVCIPWRHVQNRNTVIITREIFTYIKYKINFYLCSISSLMFAKIYERVKIDAVSRSVADIDVPVTNGISGNAIAYTCGYRVRACVHRHNRNERHARDTHFRKTSLR